METDLKLFEIFSNHPEWIADLMNDPDPEPAADIYRQLKTSKKSNAKQKATLSAVFEALLMARFRDKSAKEIIRMLQIPDITQTRAGREILARGHHEGRQEGQETGRAEQLMSLLSKKFPRLAKKNVEKVRTLPAKKLNRLAHNIFDLADEAAVIDMLNR